MRLRTLFTGLLVLAAVLGAVEVGTRALGYREAQRAADAEERAQRAAHTVSSLLVLTQEYVLYGEQRSAQQWLTTWRGLTRELGADEERAVPLDPAMQVPDLAESLRSLPQLFDELVTVSQQPLGELRDKRRELLVDNLLAEMQGLDAALSAWSLRLQLARRVFEQRVALTSIVSTALLAAVFVATGWWIARRVLLPVGRLQVAMNEVRSGRMDVRLAASGGDEIAELMRLFDHMTAELQSRALALAEREAFLLMVTDNLPARLAYFDREERYRFVNPAATEAFGLPAQAMLGRTLAEVHGAAFRAEVGPHVDAALRGESVSFERRFGSGEATRNFDARYVPDIRGDGRVAGYLALAFDVTDRVQASQRVEAALLEKEVLLKEIHHRVKNNMQVVSSLLQLQAGSLDNPQAQRALADSRDRIAAMALVHEKLYLSTNLSRIEFGDYVHELVRGLQSSLGDNLGRIALRVQAERVQLNIDRAIPAGLVLNELITNSFKHAFAQGRSGSVEVQITHAADRSVTLRVADDGVGVPPGFDPLGSTSLGLRLVRILATQLGASLAFATDQGLACSLTFGADARGGSDSAPG